MQQILLVEDDPDLRKLLGLYLVQMGYAVVEATNGKEALALQQANPSDLVLTDLLMPEKEGIETIEYLRKKDPKLKIIAMSGGRRGSAADYLKVAKMMGANHIMAKPFNYTDLADALTKVLPKS